MPPKDGGTRSIDERVAILHRDSEADSHAHVAGRARRHSPNLARKIGEALRAGVSASSPLAAPPSARCARGRAPRLVGINRREEGQITESRFQRLAAGTDGTRPHRPAVIVGVDGRRHDEEIVHRPLRCQEGLDASVPKRQGASAQRPPPRVGQMGTGSVRARSRAHLRRHAVSFGRQEGAVEDLGRRGLLRQFEGFGDQIDGCVQPRVADVAKAEPAASGVSMSDLYT